MPENPITAYFLPVSSNPLPRSQTRKRISPPKRARRAGDIEVGGQSSRKKVKTLKKDVKGKQRECLPSIPQKTPLTSDRWPTKTSESIQRVIEIEDTPPSSPVKPCSWRHATPPSSPLPELTPSPEIEPQRLSCPPPSCQVTGIVEPGSSTSSQCTSPPHSQVEFEPIPSSQTQMLDSFYYYEAPSLTCTPKTPLANVPDSPEPTVRHSEFVSSSQPYCSASDRGSDFDDFVASSQSQHMSPVPASPLDSDIEMVPSSQTQELFHSQRTELDSSQEDEPESRYSPIGPSEDYHPTVPQSRIPSPSEESEFRAVASQAQLSSSQTSEARCDDELASYESLPDVVKELQGMFGDTYESYPPDFPMSLRQ